MTVVSIKPFLVKNSGDSGFSTLTEEELSALVDNNTTSSGVSISSEKVSLLVELENRFQLSEIKYYHTGGNIEFYGSVGTSSWVPLEHIDFSGYSSVSGTLQTYVNWPSHIKINHDVTFSSSTIYEIEVEGRGDRQGYWIDGSKDGLDLGVSEDEISTVEVYNKSAIVHNFHCFIDTETEGVQTTQISISTSSGGPYYKLYDNSVSIPKDFPWFSGEFFGTQVSGTEVILETLSGTGYYRTPVFDVSGKQFSRVFWRFYDETNTSIDYSNFIDSAKTVAVRFSNVSPTGGWTSGALPDITDVVWGSLSGTLPFSYFPNNMFLPANVGQYKYVQAELQFNTSVTGSSSRLQEVGFEYSLDIGSILPNTYSTVYSKADVTSFSQGMFSGLITLYLET